MMSLIKSQSENASARVPGEPTTTIVETTVAQCCAKVSKTVAGCHD